MGTPKKEQEPEQSPVCVRNPRVCEAIEGRCSVLDVHVTMLDSTLDEVGRGNVDARIIERIKWVVADRDRLVALVREGAQGRVARMGRGGAR